MNRVEQKLWRTLPPPSEDLSLEISRDEILMIERTGKNINIKRMKDGVLDGEYRFVADPQDILFIEPILPDHPLVIKPDIPLSILPGMKLNAFIEVPLFLNLGAGRSQMENSLMEFPLGALSKSLFGNPENGEIAYFVESPLHEEVTSYPVKDNMAYSPVLIRNRSNQILHFERMILRVPNFSLYGKGETIFTSPVEINFTGQDQVSQIKIKANPPKADDMTLIAPPRRPIDKSIIKRSFYFMKTIYSG